MNVCDSRRLQKTSSEISESLERCDRLGWGEGRVCSILREESFANMQCNRRFLGDFHILQDVETLKQSHAHILVICAFLFCVKNYETSI